MHTDRDERRGLDRARRDLAQLRNEIRPERYDDRAAVRWRDRLDREDAELAALPAGPERAEIGAGLAELRRLVEGLVDERGSSGAKSGLSADAVRRVDQVSRLLDGLRELIAQYGPEVDRTLDGPDDRRVARDEHAVERALALLPPGNGVVTELQRRADEVATLAGRARTHVAGVERERRALVDRGAAALGELGEEALSDLAALAGAARDPDRAAPEQLARWLAEPRFDRVAALSTPIEALSADRAHADAHAARRWVANARQLVAAQARAAESAARFLAGVDARVDAALGEGRVDPAARLAERAAALGDPRPQARVVAAREAALARAREEALARTLAGKGVTALELTVAGVPTPGAALALQVAAVCADGRRMSPEAAELEWDAAGASVTDGRLAVDRDPPAEVWVRARSPLAPGVVGEWRAPVSFAVEAWLEVRGAHGERGRQGDDGARGDHGRNDDDRDGTDGRDGRPGQGGGSGGRGARGPAVEVVATLEDGLLCVVLGDRRWRVDPAGGRVVVVAGGGHGGAGGRGGRGGDGGNGGRGSNPGIGSPRYRGRGGDGGTGGDGGAGGDGGDGGDGGHLRLVLVGEAAAHADRFELRAPGGQAGDLGHGGGGGGSGMSGSASTGGRQGTQGRSGPDGRRGTPGADGPPPVVERR
jgi:hypothetical protein